jgi:4-hydroxythreonine-4-phosphate dehydrogenase
MTTNSKNQTSEKPRVTISMGDPAGIGPEVVLKAIQDPKVVEACTPVIVGDLRVLKKASDVLERTGFFKVPSQHSQTYSLTVEGDGALRLPQGVEVVDLHNMPTDQHKWGELSAQAGQAAYEYITHGATMVMNGEAMAIVNAPANKEALKLAGSPYTGQTEIMAALTNTKNYAMMLAGPSFRVIHVSTHVSLEEAIRRVKTSRILTTIKLAHDVLRQEGIDQPRIAVAGLNPHAGEHGVMGHQDEEEIRPAVEAAKQDGINASGPHSPDAVFVQAHEGRFDIVVVMYHDQGHIPIKLAGRGQGVVNVTVGIPIIRASVDHGTAFDIAGKGIATEEPMIECIIYTSRLARGKMAATSLIK